jgi:autophagy-related protein 2
MVRLDIRCPAPPNRRGSWGDGAHLRSGIVTLDIHGLCATIKQPGEVAPRRMSERHASEPKASVEWQKMLLFFCRVPGEFLGLVSFRADLVDKRAAAFIAIGPLVPDPTDHDVLLPIIEVRSTTNPTSQIKTSTITCRIPSVQAKIRQRTIEGLQFFADDITHWLDGAFGDGSAPRPRDDLKMIGSRFFGSKGSSSASSSAEEDEGDDTTAATVLRICVTEADIALHVPRAKVDVPTQDRILSLRGSDTDVKLESNTTGRQETALTLIVLDAEFADRTDPSTPNRILSRTTPLSLTANHLPLLNLRFSSLTHPQSGLKETGIKVSLSSSTFHLHQNFAWAKDLALFAKTPEGVFEDVVPSEITRVGFSLVDCAVHAKSPTLGGAIVVVVGSLEGKMDTESGAESKAVEVGLGNLVVLAVDDMSATTDLYGGNRTSAEAYLVCLSFAYNGKS